MVKNDHGIIVIRLIDKMLRITLAYLKSRRAKVLR